MVALKGMPDIGDPITAVIRAVEVTPASFGPLNSTRRQGRIPLPITVEPYVPSSR
ncbi:hypothetical protein [Accumulibacter sp.]|uniref:hypothetical protein n=1 Tax=Accumulibacter sp. TaxID=2053492 RepID=UPI0026088F0F|nr:hypothetical protein [Accumulibacter sp.]